MLFHIPIPATHYTATVEGSVVKDVTCERCGHPYSYTMSRIVSGTEKVLFSSSRGDEKALKKAQANLADLALGIIVFVFALAVRVIPGQGLPKVSSILQCVLFVLAIASPGLLIRGLRSLILLHSRSNG
jgi:hypothetical protein